MESLLATEKFKALAKKFSQERVSRQTELAAKELERKNTTAYVESYPYFQETITKRTLKVEKALDDLSSSDLDETTLSDRFDEISEDLKGLQRFFASSTMFLTQFEVRIGQNTIDKLENRYNTLVKKFLPRPKFAFTSRKAVAEKKIVSMTMGEILKDGKIVSNVPLGNSYVDYSTGFSNRNGEDLSLEGEAIDLKDVNLSNLKDCTVTLKGAPGLLTVTSLENCKVFSGPVATSVFIENCSDSVFKIPCQQLRIHDTKLCEFHTHITSRAIIEGTKQVTFAPYDWKYEGIEKDFQKARLDPETNNWDSVDDFNWLATDKPSPNWSRFNDQNKKETTKKSESNQK